MVIQAPRLRPGPQAPTQPSQAPPSSVFPSLEPKGGNYTSHNTKGFSGGHESEALNHPPSRTSTAQCKMIPEAQPPQSHRKQTLGEGDKNKSETTTTHTLWTPEIDVASLKSNVFISPVVRGLQIFDGFISHVEQCKLLAFCNSLEWSNTISRRTKQFGWEYRHADRLLVKLEGMEALIPPELSWMVDRLSSLTGTTFNQLIVNEYTGSQGINPHIDSLDFGDPIVSLSLPEDCIMKMEKVGE